MDIRRLGYIGVSVNDIGAWRSYAELLGTMVLPSDGGFKIGIDERPLGKHTNDQMVSFYSRTPSGFDVEFGCNGLRVDDTTWTVTEVTKPSFWGHRPSTAA